jgi:hypothetical protein
MYHGPPIEDEAILEQLPGPYANLLRNVNGYVAYYGGLHVYGACHEPVWHSLRYAWFGDGALHRLYPRTLTPDDVPFAEDALGDQYVARGGIVHRLSGESGELESLDVDLVAFDANARADPLEYLRLHPLWQFRHDGGTLEPGHLLSVWPPFVMGTNEETRSFRAVPAVEHRAFLADFARQIRDLPDGTKVQFSPQ